MKKIFFKSLLLSSFALSIFSCQEDDSTPTASTSVKANILSTENSSVFLDSNFPNNPAVTFAWDNANYGVQTETKYDIQVSKTADFANFVTAGTSIGSSRTQTFVVSEFNSSVIKAGLEPDTSNKMYVRLMSYIGTTKSLSEFSNIINMNVTPFERVLPIYYFVGAAVSSGWNNNNNNQPLFIDKNDENVYNYTGYFNNDQFKILSKKGAWQPQYGKGSSDGTLAANLGGGSDPGEISIADKGLYKVKVNFQTFKYQIEKITDTPTVYTSMGMLGTAIPGSSSTTDIKLTKSTFDPHMWTSTLTLTKGEFKFRGNDDNTKTWATESSQTGQATLNGTSIPVLSGGNYSIWFSDLDGRYLLVKN